MCINAPGSIPYITIAEYREVYDNLEKLYKIMVKMVEHIWHLEKIFVSI